MGDPDMSTDTDTKPKIPAGVRVQPWINHRCPGRNAIAQVHADAPCPFCGESPPRAIQHDTEHREEALEETCRWARDTLLRCLEIAPGEHELFRNCVHDVVHALDIDENPRLKR